MPFSDLAWFGAWLAPGLERRCQAAQTVKMPVVGDSPEAQVPPPISLPAGLSSLLLLLSGHVDPPLAGPDRLVRSRTVLNLKQQHD